MSQRPASFYQRGPYEGETQQDNAEQFMNVRAPPPPPLKSSARGQNAGATVQEKTDRSQEDSMEAHKRTAMPPVIDSIPIDRPPMRVSKAARFWWLLFAIRYFFIVAVVAIGLAVPLILYRTDKSFGFSDDDNTPSEAAVAVQKNNQIFYVFCWLEATWLAACVCHLAILVLPFVFYVVANYVNIAHRRYWRAFWTLKWPVTYVGASITSFVTFHYVRLSLRNALSRC